MLESNQPLPGYSRDSPLSIQSIVCPDSFELSSFGLQPKVSPRIRKTHSRLTGIEPCLGLYKNPVLPLHYQPLVLPEGFEPSTVRLKVCSLSTSGSKGGGLDGDRTRNFPVDSRILCRLSYKTEGCFAGTRTPIE